MTSLNLANAETDSDEDKFQVGLYMTNAFSAEQWYEFLPGYHGMLIDEGNPHNILSLDKVQSMGFNTGKLIIGIYRRFLL